MGTNYYLITNECDCCNRSDKIHIGKSSVGWKFLLRYYDENNNDIGLDVKNIDDWISLLQDSRNRVMDEFFEDIENHEMIKKILKTNNDNKLKNHVELGDNTYYLDDKGFNFCRSWFE